MTQLLYPGGKNFWWPLDRRMGGPQNQSGHGSEDKKRPSLHLPAIEPWSSIP